MHVYVDDYGVKWPVRDRPKWSMIVMRDGGVMARQRNDRLDVLLQEAGWSRAQAASAFNRVAHENGLAGSANIGRSHISMWVGGTHPSGESPIILCQALSRRLRRLVTPEELGFTVPTPSARSAPGWSIDPLITLIELGRADLDADRRSLLTGTVYSAVTLALPGEVWWRSMAEPLPSPYSSRRLVGSGDVETVRELTSAFSRIDQRRGGGHGRKALVQYLHTDVTGLLQSNFANDDVRRDIFTAAGELTYLIGWMAFDNGEHALAQRYLVAAVKLAARADNPPLTGHILRALAHQAIDLGAPRQAIELSAASIEGQRYTSATPRERALLGVVHARSLAASGSKQAAARALLRAEDDLASAGDGIQEPDRTFFFGEASLAHETACTLRECGDRQGAISQFRRSAKKRGPAFRRTHAVTLGYLGAAQLSIGNVEEACTTWNTALDAMDEGIYSGRARQTVVDMRRLLSSYRNRNIAASTELDARAARYLAQVD